MFSLTILKFFFNKDIKESSSFTKLLVWIVEGVLDNAYSLVSSSSGNKNDAAKAIKARNPQKTNEWKTV